MDDLIITNARIADGTGRAVFVGDVVVNDGLITEVVEHPSTGPAIQKATRTAKSTIDATGLLVTPGFVDIHKIGRASCRERV